MGQLFINQTAADSVNIIAYGADKTGTTSCHIALQNAMSYLRTTGRKGLIYFPAGKYLFTQPVSLLDSIILKGQGNDVTTLNFATANSGNDMLLIEGNVYNDTTGIIGAATKNANTVKVANATKFLPGDFVQLKEVDTSFMFSNWAYGSLGQMLQIQKITGDSITFFSEMRLTYPAALKPFIQKIKMKKEVGISCLKIVRTQPSIGIGHSNIALRYAYNCWVKGVISDSADFAHVEISQSLNNIITESFFKNAYSYGDQGNGYGIACQYTASENVVYNNVFSKLRHAMLLQAGANGNVFAYNYSREAFWVQGNFPPDVSGDVVLHGNYPFANLIEHNIVQNIVVDNSHAANGPYNLFFRNRAQHVGIFMNDGAGDSTSFIGNEISKPGNIFYGLYNITGQNNFTYGNNKFDTCLPIATTALTDTSYYLQARPAFITGTWPAIGYPSLLNSGTIPAFDRYINNTLNPTICKGQNIVLANQNMVLKLVQQSQQVVQLSWQYLGGSNRLPNLLLQLSYNGVNFFTIDTLRVANGLYNYYTNSCQYNLLYFKLLQMGTASSGAASNILAIKSICPIGIQNVNVFPNPATSNINIFFKATTAGIMQAALFDAKGIQLHTQQIYYYNQNNLLHINVQQFCKGYYMLRLQCKEGVKNIWVQLQ